MLKLINNFFAVSCFEWISNFVQRYHQTGENKAANHKIADQTVWMHSLISTFVVHIWHKQVFPWRGVAHLIPNMVTFKRFNPKWHFRGWVQDWRTMCYFSAFMICHFSIPSFTMQQNSDSLQVNIYLSRKHFRRTYTDNPNFFRAG